MKDEFANRQNMHLAVLALLADPAHQPVWQNKAPVIFSTRAAVLGPKVNALTELIAAQQSATTGFAADKAREEEELETIAHEISEALTDWFEDQGKEAEAAASCSFFFPRHVISMTTDQSESPPRFRILWARRRLVGPANGKH